MRRWQYKDIDWGTSFPSSIFNILLWPNRSWAREEEEEVKQPPSSIPPPSPPYFFSLRCLLGPNEWIRWYIEEGEREKGEIYTFPSFALAAGCCRRGQQTMGRWKYNMAPLNPTRKVSGSAHSAIVSTCIVVRSN